MRLPVGIGFVTIRGKSTSNVFGDVRTRNKKPHPHQGWDIAAQPGSPVYAITDGVIEFTDISPGDYGGNVCLRFQHRGTTLYAFYAHLQSILCGTGDVVKEGSVLGRSGQTGNASGQHHSEAHLHFEIRTIPHPGLGLSGRRDPGSVLGFAPVVETILTDLKAGHP